VPLEMPGSVVWLPPSLSIVVGEARDAFMPAIAQAAASRVVGHCPGEGIEMGSVIRPESKIRIEGLITQAVSEGARGPVDGQGAKAAGHPKGNSLKHTILDALPIEREVARTEIFGPVLSVAHTDTLDEAIRLINSGRYGNMACLFTSPGAAARQFRHQAQAGNKCSRLLHPKQSCR
jgi:malonate-semialdehyde dehydrogenase (acetylating)/methylmalonate-semialdehyde dehydrogenase